MDAFSLENPKGLISFTTDINTCLYVVIVMGLFMTIMANGAYALALTGFTEETVTMLLLLDPFTG